MKKKIIKNVRKNSMHHPGIQSSEQNMVKYNALK